VVADPRHHSWEIATGGEKRGALDDVASRGVRTCQALHEGLDLSVAGRVVRVHENSVTE
jgi:hypothetical protein